MRWHFIYHVRDMQEPFSACSAYHHSYIARRTITGHQTIAYGDFSAF